MSSELAIETLELRKRFGAQEVVSGLTLAVPRGSICGFLGKNGAGKTTTLKMLMGMTSVSGGDGRVLGLQIGDPRESTEIRRRTGFVSEDKQFPWSITVGELLRFTRSLLSPLAYRPGGALPARVPASARGLGGEAVEGPAQRPGPAARARARPGAAAARRAHGGTRRVDDRRGAAGARLPRRRAGHDRLLLLASARQRRADRRPRVHHRPGADAVSAIPWIGSWPTIDA